MCRRGWKEAESRPYDGKKTRWEENKRVLAWSDLHVGLSGVTLGSLAPARLPQDLHVGCEHSHVEASDLGGTWRAAEGNPSLPRV